ncbi:metallophosphoesterase family protein [Longimicrobium sp.]|uniref:metallophosphoesterase family protein n=1 Tax=Longimicrobium sp. TaxID=2029185 RepID=UPI002E374389|nr:metallophosphoesterase family protein [Longimicrobium sp.]HEX6038754.1 metallophosphoesterase family protein [Longimicrobium sp.]
MKIGIISDTHGLLRAQVFEVFAGVEHILHAGDIGDADILTELQALAPVTAVWGNVDGMDIRGRVPEVARLELGGVRVAMLHGMQLGSPTPEKAAAAHPDAGLVVFGHSHRPLIRQVGSVLAVNPGSAGRRRFKDPVTVALAELADGRATARLVDLDPDGR